MEHGRPVRAFGARTLLCRLACAAMNFGLATAFAAEITAPMPRLPAHAQATVEVAHALRVDSSADRRVELPDRVVADGATAVAHARYRVLADLGSAPARGLALYFPGLRAHATVSLNGHDLHSSPTESLGTAPRSLRAVRVIALPPQLVRPGVNSIELQLRAPAALSLSPVWIGDEGVLADKAQRRVLGMTIGPLIVAAFMVSLGLTVLVLYVRRRDEAMYAYFGLGALVWGLQTAWSALPEPLLPDAHRMVWLTSMYVFFVVMIVLFALRFAGVQWLRGERLLKRLALAWPLVMYAALAAGLLQAFEMYSRLALVVLAFGVLAVVAARAWRQRDVGSVLLIVSGLAGASFGLRDWLLDASGTDNNPVFLTPYAGLPFVVLMSWFLVDRFVRASNALESLNRELEVRVERKSAELVTALDEMRAARDTAESANRAKSRFLAAASHDLRQPIHALGLYLGALRQRRADNEASEVLSRMSTSLGTLDSMFNALLDISRMDAGALTAHEHAFDLDALLHRLAQEFAAEAAQRGLRIAVRVGAAGAPALVRSDPLLLERVLRNLLANAVKYTDTGGVLVSARRRADCWRVEIWDTGHGIAPEQQQRVFDEFYQVGNPQRDRGSGLGLGLSIVRRLTDLLGLTLHLHSRPGRGTRFVLDLPVTSERVLVEPQGPVPGSLRGAVIGVIEDDVEVRDAMRILLVGWDAQVVDGSDADELLAELGERALDALVADLRLVNPRDGVGEVARVRERLQRPGLPALIVSGDSAPERVRLMQASGLPWLAKPVAAARLRSWLLAVVPRPPQPTSAERAEVAQADGG
jgi:signal transduction histidine kinase/CheY-like chemotaxis protein